LDVPPESDILDLKRSIEGGGEWHIPANCQQMLQADNALTARTTLQDEERIAALGTEDSAIVSLTMIVSLEKVFRELGSNNPDCRIDALQQLCKFGLQTDANVVGAVINHILDNDNDGANVRSEAVKALGQITRKDNQLAINAVLACLRDGNAQTRDNAVGALAKIVENGQVEALDFESDFLSAKLDSNSFTLSLKRRLYDITLDAFAKGLAHLTNLTVLRLTLYECYQLKSVDELGKGLANLTRLTELKLDFSSAGVSSVVEVGKGLAELRALTNVKLNFSFCYELTSVDEVGKGISNLTNLTDLHLDFSRCHIPSVDEVGKGIAELHNLTTLSLDLSGHCDWGTKITSVDEIGKCLSHLTRLEKLDMSLYACFQLKSVDEVGKGLADLTNLTSLDLNFCGCESLATVDEVGKGLVDLHCLTSLDLKFFGCLDLATIDASGERLAGRVLVDISELWQSLPWK